MHLAGWLAVVGGGAACQCPASGQHLLACACLFCRPHLTIGAPSIEGLHCIACARVHPQPHWTVAGWRFTSHCSPNPTLVLQVLMSTRSSAAAILQGEERVLEVVDAHTQVCGWVGRGLGRISGGGLD